MSKPLHIFEASLHGISLVEASAGTGKTYNITSLYIRAVIERNLIPADILVLTYTEAATAELKFRLRSRLREALEAFENSYNGDDTFLKDLTAQNYINPETKLKNAIDSFDEAAVFTIHGFCNRLLNENSLQFNVPPSFDVISDESDLVQDAADEYWRAFVKSAKENKYDTFIYEFLIDEGFGPDELQSVILEIINRPYVELEPFRIGFEYIKPEIDELINKFKEVKYYWKEEGPELEAIYRGQDLNRNTYRKSVEDRYWDELTDWLNAERPSVYYFSELERFGLKLSRSATKGASIPELKLCRAIDQFIGIAENLKLIKAAFIKESLEVIKSNVERKKERTNALSYNDFLIRVDESLRKDKTGKISENLSRKYPVALVDEFQDTDPVQYSIFRQIYHNRKEAALFMIGDPKQAIYGFRGADIHTYFSARKDAQSSQIYSLTSNYRSNAEMIGAVNNLFTSSEQPFLIDNLTFEPAHYPASKESSKYFSDSDGNHCNAMQIIRLTYDDKPNKPKVNDEIFSSVAKEIINLLHGNFLLGGEKAEEKDIAVLVRKSKEGEQIQQRLREFGINSVLKSKSSVFKTPEADELFLVLKAIQHVSFDPGIRAALATHIAGYSAVQIKNLLEKESEWAAVYDQFMNFKLIWDKEGIEATIEALLSYFKSKENLAGEVGAERRITNLMHLSELLSKAEREQRLLGKSLLKWFYRKKTGNTSKAEEEELRLESDENLIQISTIHASKGLEYPIVFCPFLWESPRKKNKNEILRYYKENALHIDFNIGIENEERAYRAYLDYREEMAESVRLAYVALTRAKYACFLHLPEYKDIELSSFISVIEGGEITDQRIRNKILGESDKVDFSFDALCESLSGKENIVVRDSIETEHGEVSKDNKSISSENLKPSVFKRKDMQAYSRLISYSSLSQSKHELQDAHDFDSLSISKPRQTENSERSRFTFPKGAKAGTFLHKIFEDIRFDTAENLEEIVKAELKAHGFPEYWKTEVVKWVKEALAHELYKPSIKLGNLKEDDVLKEMEFHFPVHLLMSSVLWEIVRSENLLLTNPEQVSGFMKGFIDLVFRTGNKYYILDYKSNYLGGTPEDYSGPALSEEIIQSAYDLQYHIYSLALHRFLKLNMPGYTYDKNFGGVFYLFLRGINKGQEQSGVFFDKPSFEIVNKLDDYFQEGELL